MRSKLTAEFIGTFMIVFLGCGTIASSLNPSMISVVFGLTVAIMIYSLGHISGAHFNPAVSIAFAIARHFPMREVIPYIVVQLGAGVLASSLISFMLPNAQAYGATVPHPDIGQLRALAWEAIISFNLMFVIIAVATDTRAVGTMAGMAIGAAVTLGALVGGPLTGASMNPARSFGPALLEGHTGVLWVYFVGPIFGATAAAILYEWVRCDTKKKDAKGCC